MALNQNLERDLRKAVKHFWSTRDTQAQKQGSTTGARDAGSRTAVTGGRQMDGFVSLVRSHLCGSGLPEAHVYCEKRVELPGWYRPEKKWDLLVVADGQFLAGIEFKSQVGSFGNNYNNRTEEAIGSACEMLLEEASESTRPVRAQEPHFKVFPEFKDASYAKRYEILLTKLVRERFYDSACFLLSNAKNGRKGDYKEPAEELNFEKFMASLLGRAISISKARN
jgi:hypothetical protein